MMKRSVVAVAALALAASIGAAARAMPLAASNELQAAASGTSLVEKAQFIYGGRNYCFYPDGWHGPGWYWCGYATRRGRGWGGAEGWHGWHRGHVEERRHHDDHREHHDRGHHH